METLTPSKRPRLALGPHTAACAVLLFVAVPAFAQDEDRARAEALAARGRERLQALHLEADQLAAQARTLLGDLRKLEVERQIKLEALRTLDTEASQVERELTDTGAELTTLQAAILATRPDLVARLVEMYKLGEAGYARLMLSTSDVRRIGQAARMAAALAKLDRDRVAAHQRTVEALASARATLELRNRRLSTLRAEASRAEADVARAARARSDAIAEIDRQRDLNAQLAGELQSAQQKLQAALAALPAEPDAATPPILPLKAFRTDLDWPVTGVVRRRFSGPAAGRTPASNGIEIAAVEGAPVTAVHGGSVAFADSFSGFGNLIIIDHGAQAFTLYGNLLDIGVKKGTPVDAGQRLGSVGASIAGPAGLYFEMRVDGQPVDPLQWLKTQ